MDGLDDLCVVDPLEVDRRDAEVAVAELALDDDERDALVGHLDGVPQPELMRCEASANARGLRPCGATRRARRPLTMLARVSAP